MKKQILFFAFMFIGWGAIGQTWCPAGAQWYYGFDTGSNGENGYYYITYTGDTLINTNVCKKMNRTEVSHLNALTTGTVDTTNLGETYTYADNDKVYVFQLGQFYTLYDFSATIGSTWVIPAMQLAVGCPINGIVLVTGTGTVIINGISLRYLTIVAFSGSSWFFGANGGTGASAKIIEKIGVVNQSPNSYLFPFTSDICDGIADNYGEGQFSEFRCYSDSSGFAYSLAAQCNLINFPQGIKDVSTTLNNLMVYPNPMDGRFTIDCSFVHQFIGSLVTVVNVLGEKVFQSIITNNQSTINISQLKKGIYFLQITDEDKNVFNKKIILQ